MAVRTLRYNSFALRNWKGATFATDRDALAFLEAAQIYDRNQQKAVVDLVRRLKNAGLWSKMKAIYPFIGGTATTHKWNLKDPRDVDAAFRLTFSGGWTHSSTGAKPNGTSGYADTFCTPNTNMSSLNTHGSAYARNDNPNVGGDYYLFGSYKSDLNVSFYGINNFPSTTRKILAGASVAIANLFNITHTSHIGLFLVSITSNAVNAHKLYHNASTLAQNQNTDTNLSDKKITLSALNFTGGIYGYSYQELAFATIGDGLTDTDATNLYNIVDVYQKRLGRAV